ncbi:MAG: NAD(P)H-quinone oxidoreductase subunit F [Pseudanabaenaceae cyanobacterium]
MGNTAVLIPGYGFFGVVLTLPWTLGLIRRSGQRPAAYINILMTALAVLHSSWLLVQVWGKPSIEISYQWLQIADLTLPLTFAVSPLTVGAALVASVLSLLAQVYGLASMEMDWSLGRFYALMGFFEGAITGIAFSDSLFLSYTLLEMLTLSTYLLVGFWYAQPAVVTAARDAFWTKRLGDLLLLMGLVALSSLAPSLNFSDLEAWAQLPSTLAYFQEHPLVATLLGLSLIAGPTGKCAQFPLHLWLDEAMEGPNPASVLRNSAVVAAGAYVLIKMQPVLALCPITAGVLIILGSITAVGASLVAIAQIDIKRAFSHSTSAYLGLVFMAVGLNEPTVALSFLLSHALARGLIFMAVGGIMLFTFTQDLTQLGGLGQKMPATMSAYVLGAASSVAIAPLGCFWTMLSWYVAVSAKAPSLLPVICLVNGVTSFGVVRVFALVFLGQSKPRTRRVPEVTWLAAIPMLSLAVLNLLLPIGLLQWELVPYVQQISLADVLLLTGSGLVGVILAGLFYIKTYPTGSTVPMPPATFLRLKKPIQDFFANDLNVREIYKYTIVGFVKYTAQVLAWLDKHFVDGLANLVGIASIFGGESLRYTITGRSQQYVLTIMLGTIAVILIAYWRLQALP